MKDETYKNMLGSLSENAKKSIPSVEQFKKIVKHEFETIYKEKGFKLSHIYNKKARELGFKNWNLLSAFLKKHDEYRK